MQPSWFRFLSDETGATAIEYALIAALLSVAIASTLPFVGGALKDRFQLIYDAFKTSAD